MEAAIEASRARATVGEISDALERIYTRHRAVIRSVSGVYGSAYDQDEGFQRIQGEVAAFAEQSGRRPSSRANAAVSAWIRAKPSSPS